MLPAACLKGSIAEGDVCVGCAVGTYAPANATTCTNCSDGFTTLRMNSFVDTQCDRKLAAVTALHVPSVVAQCHCGRQHSDLLHATEWYSSCTQIPQHCLEHRIAATARPCPAQHNCQIPSPADVLTLCRAMPCRVHSRPSGYWLHGMPCGPGVPRRCSKRQPYLHGMPCRSEHHQHRPERL